jgi:hypothetical protein
MSSPINNCEFRTGLLREKIMTADTFKQEILRSAIQLGRILTLPPISC